MFHQRRFARVKPSGPMSRSGKIIVDARTPVIDCQIIDYSAGGACLDVANPAALPKRFDLLYGGKPGRSAAGLGRRPARGCVVLEVVTTAERSATDKAARVLPAPLAVIGPA